MIKRRLKILLVLIIILLVGISIFLLARSVVKNGYDSKELVVEEEDLQTPSEEANIEEQEKVIYNELDLSVNRENYIAENSEDVSSVDSTLEHIRSIYQGKLSNLSGDMSADSSNTLLVRYKEDIDFSTVLDEYNYIAIVYGANVVDFLGNNCVVYSYNIDDDKEQYIVYDYSDLNSFNSESQIGQEDSLNITSNASIYENYNGVDIIYTKGVKIQ